MSGVRLADMSNVFSVRHVNTEPGADSGPFCPPAGFEGGAADYMLLIRSRFQNDRQHRVRFASYARSYSRNLPVVISGPYRRVAMAALKKITLKLFPKPEDFFSQEEYAGLSN